MNTGLGGSATSVVALTEDVAKFGQRRSGWEKGVSVTSGKVSFKKLMSVKFEKIESLNAFRMVFVTLEVEVVVVGSGMYSRVVLE